MAVTKATYWQRGETIDYTNATGAAIEAGAIVEMEALIGVAGEDIPQGAMGGVHIEGVFYFPKDTGEIKQGALVSYAEGKVKACEDGGQAVGVAVAKAESADEKALVKINVGAAPKAAASEAV